MKFLNSLNSVAGLVLLAALLTACGGGGGGGGGDDGLVYTGKTTKAKIRGGNAPELTGNVVGLYGVVGSFDLGPRPNPGAALPRPNHLRSAFDRIAEIRKNQVADTIRASFAARLGHRDEEVDEEIDCDPGRISIEGVIDDVDATGVLTFDFQGCRFAGARIDGEVVARIDAVEFFSPVDLMFTRLRLTFNKLRIRDSDIDISIGGTVRYSLDVAADEENETIVDMVLADNDSDRMWRIVDLVSVYSFDNIRNPNQLMINIRSGRVFDSKYGYVDARSTVVITFSNLSQDFPNAGTYELTAEGSILATALGSTTVRIQADTDDNLGNGYEFDRILNWSDLDL